MAQDLAYDLGIGEKSEHHHGHGPLAGGTPGTREPVHIQNPSE
jgi:hypothetical protein